MVPFHQVRYTSFSYLGQVEQAPYILHFSIPHWSSTMPTETVSQNSKEGKDPELVVAVSDPIDNPTNIYRPEVDTSCVDERKLMRRIDWHVVPWLAVLYLLNFLDRGSIGNAKVNVPIMNTICRALI